MFGEIKAKLRSRLERLYQRFHNLLFLASSFDPLQFPRRYRRPEDQELAAFFAASLAYGHIQQIRRSVESLLARMGDSPHRFVLSFDPRRDAGCFEGFVHRFNTGLDFAVLCSLLRQVLERHGSLGDYFLLGYRASDEDVGPALIRFVEGILSLESTPFYPKGVLPGGAGVRFLLPSPAQGSACKKLNLFLRWMVRKDELDLGLWWRVSPAKLITPIDTHVLNFCQQHGLTRLKTPSWRMAQEITRHFRELNPEDPIKYDFAISHYGMGQESGVRWINGRG